jgi:hypothetical protein
MTILNNGTYRVTREYISGEKICFLDIKNGNGYDNIASGSEDYCRKEMTKHRERLK